MSNDPKQPRDVIFISHATPEDNAFTLWLGAKLTALGYEVFADVMVLHGGQDWERILENAIRQRAFKFLLVATSHGVDKQGVRNEITIADETAKKIGDKEFIIPLRLEKFEAPLKIAHAQYINFESSWANGFSEILELLHTTGAPRQNNPAIVQNWQNLQLKDSQIVQDSPEPLISNWLEIKSLPEEIIFYDFKGGVSLGVAQLKIETSPIPVEKFKRGLLSFANHHQLQEHFGENLPLFEVARIKTTTFMEGWKDQNLLSRDARSILTKLAHQSLNAFFRKLDLASNELSNGKIVWWPKLGQVELEQIKFKWDIGLSGSRQLIGKSNKRNFYWHYGIWYWMRTFPFPHLCIGGSVTFTTDGRTRYGDKKRQHRMRRSHCKAWRNPKWRDLLLTFLFWVSKGQSELIVPMAENADMVLNLPPVILNAPFSIKVSGDEEVTPEIEAEEELAEEEEIQEYEDEENEGLEPEEANDTKEDAA